MTVQKLYDKYMEVKANEIRETSLRKAECVLSLHVLPQLKDVKLTKLNTEKLLNWKTGIEQKDIGITTKKHIYSYFRSMLNFAVKMEYLQSNPLVKVGNFKDAYQSRESIDYYTANEFKKFISAAQSEAEPIRLLRMELLCLLQHSFLYRRTER